MSRPRVLFVGAFPPPHRQVFGGIVTSCRALLESSFPKRVELELLDSTQLGDVPSGFVVRLAGATRRLASFVLLFEQNRPDAVLLFTSFGASVLEKGTMGWYARLRGSRSLAFPRGGRLLDRSRRSRFTRGWVKLALAGCEKILCQGPAWQRLAVESLGFDEENAPIIQNWTATKELLRIGKARREMPREGPVRFLFLGAMEREKGIFELLEACSLLAPQREFLLDLCGKGRGEAEARTLVESCGLADRVHFRGWVRDEALKCRLRESDVLVLPSWTEGLPNVMIEAMAAGLAVIVSAVGNVPDVVNDKEQALMVPPRDVDALAGAMKRLIDDHELRSALASRGHNYVAEHYSVEPAVEKLMAAIADIP